MFSFCTSLEDLILPSSIKTIYANAFSKCTCTVHYLGEENSVTNKSGYGIHFCEETGSAATCTENGKEAGWYCADCDRHLVVGDIIPATNHKGTLVQVEAKAPTCTGIGWEAYEYCTVCDYTTYKEIPSKGHTAGSVVVESIVAPTCTAEGSYKNVTYCTVCGTKTSSEKITVDALGHDYKCVVTTEPTCTAKGEKTYTCNNDSRHKYTEEIAAKGHTLTQVEAKAQTCSEDGWKAYEYCTACNYTTYEEIPASHSWVDGECDVCFEVCEHADVTGATCIMPVVCGVCSAAVYDYTNHDGEYVTNVNLNSFMHVSWYNCCFAEAVYVEHDFKDYQLTTPASCDVNALETGYCECGATGIRGIPNSALGHSFVTYTIEREATCEIPQVRVSYCENGCGRADRITDYETAPGHNWSEFVSDGDRTCMFIGTETSTCTTCGLTDSRVDYDGVVTDHIDADGDFKCDYDCGYEFENNCDHLCHKSGFMSFIWKIINFFNKLFKAQPVCECGVAHY